jgi:hypothetical protein
LASEPGSPAAPYAQFFWAVLFEFDRGRRHAACTAGREEPVISTASVLIHDKEFATWR